MVQDLSLRSELGRVVLFRIHPEFAGPSRILAIGHPCIGIKEYRRWVLDRVNTETLREGAVVLVFGREFEDTESGSAYIFPGRRISRLGIAPVFNLPDQSLVDIGRVRVPAVTNRKDLRARRVETDITLDLIDGWFHFVYGNPRLPLRSTISNLLFAPLEITTSVKLETFDLPFPVLPIGFLRRPVALHHELGNLTLFHGSPSWLRASELNGVFRDMSPAKYRSSSPRSCPS